MYVFFVGMGENGFETLLSRHDLNSVCISFRKPDAGSHCMILFLMRALTIRFRRLFWSSCFQKGALVTVVGNLFMFGDVHGGVCCWTIVREICLEVPPNFPLWDWGGEVGVSPKFWVTSGWCFSMFLQGSRTPVER